RTGLSLPVDKSGLVQNSLVGRLRLILLALFLILIFAGFVYRFWLGIEASTNDATYNQNVRSKYGSIAALQVIGLVILLTGLNVVANYRNLSFDLTPGYFSFSEPAQSIISAIDRPIQVHSFLPVQQVVSGRSTSSDLLNISEDLRVLVEQLQIINPKITVEFHNSDLIDTENPEFRGIANGTFLVRSFSQSAATDTPFAERKVYVNGAKDLDSFEKNMVEAIVQVTLPPSKVYFAVSNGERKSMLGRRTSNLINEFQNSLKLYNLQVTNLESKPNLMIPEDAKILALIGPKIAYSSESRKSILDYWNRGGQLFITIDPTGNEDFNWLLTATESKYRLQPSYLSMFSDRPGLLATNEFGDHSITRSLQLNRSAVLFLGNGFFNIQNSNVVPDLNQSILLESDSRSFNDLNRNGKIDTGEISKRYLLAIALELKDKGQAVITSDSEWLTDGMLLFPIENSNLKFGLESMLWLVGKTEIPGVIIKEKSNRAIQVTDELKSRNIILGVFVFPIFTLMA
ncbi:MAG: Gldg family protein, partial [Leptonema sp. (in: Bacteria)]|nr:Gldg family protein [Leptonema sp. (in: bacteria)]